MFRLTVTRLTLLLALAAGHTLGQSDDDAVYPDDESVASERCINLSRLRDTEVISERSILFVMRGGATYRNVLPSRCRGLSRHRAFSYQTTMNRLCDSDMITVLPAGGLSGMTGPTCGLGLFYPLSEVEVEALRLEAERVEELGLDEEP